jgi:PAS domain-containing protein
MSCIINNYKAWVTEGLEGGKTPEQLDEYWKIAMLESSSPDMKTVINRLLESNVTQNKSINIAIQYNNGKAKLAKMLGVDKEGEGYRLYTPNGSYMFEYGRSIGKPLYSTKIETVKVPVMANTVDLEDTTREDYLKTVRVMSRDGVSAVSETLMSDRDAEIKGHYEKQADLIKDPTKAIELAERLAESDSVNISSKEKTRLINILGVITDPLKNFIPDTAVYLNEKAEKTGGIMVLDGKNAGIYINKTDRAPTNVAQMSAVAAYVHEMIHGTTAYAFRQRGAKIAGTKQRLMTLRTRVMKRLTAEDLLPDVVINRDAELKEAEKTLDYMNSKLEEFMAIALTNEKVFNVLRDMKAYRDPKDEYRNIWEQILDFAGRLLDIVFRVVRKEGKEFKNDELLMKLMLELAENNNRLVEVERQGIVSRAFEVKDELDDMGAAMFKKLESLAKKGKIKDMPQNMSKAQEVVWFGKNLWRFLVNSDTRDAFEWILSTHGMKREGAVQSFVRAIRENDTLQNAVERMGLLSGQIDKRREDKATAVSIMATEGFSTRPTDNELKALTLAGLDVELGGIYETYGDERIAELLSSNEVLAEEASKIRKELRSKASSKGIGNYYVAQADGLGRYMASHVSSKSQAFNAEMIAGLNGTLVVDKGTTDTEVIELIDTLATLEGLKYTDRSSKDAVADLIGREPDGVKNVMYLHKSFVNVSKKELFDGDKAAHRIKGYNKEIFDDTITIKVAPIADKVSLEKEGFTLDRILEKAKGDSSTTTMALYVNKHHMTQSFNRSAMRMTDLNRKGTSLAHAGPGEGGADRWIKTKRDIAALKSDAQKEILSMFEGRYEFKSTGGLAPVHNQEGVAIDYRYMMPKAEKARLLKQDLRANVILGRNMASIQDKIESSQFDKELMVIIRDDMENYVEGSTLGKNLKEYTTITKDSTDKDVRDIYSVLPKEVKRDIETNGEIAVRRDLLYAYFGFRDPTIVDILGVKLLPKAMKELVRQVEHWWREVVQIHKVDIIIRIPMVLMHNMVSNFVLGMLAGFGPYQVLKYQWDGFREIKQFQKNIHELIRLKESEKSGNVMKDDLKRIKQLENELEMSPAKDLIDEGLFQAIIEDASIDDIRVSNRITQKKDELLAKYGAPEWVKSGADILWLTDKTKFFKMMTTATQYSDFIARYAQYNLMMGKMEKDYVKETGKQPDIVVRNKMKAKAIITVKEAYINYDLPSSKWTQYANDMGLVMFTKYFERIQRVIKTTGQDRPVTMLMALLGQAYLTGDIEDITDQSVFTKNWGGVFHLDPSEHIMGAVTPTLGEYVYDAYKMVK